MNKIIKELLEKHSDAQQVLEDTIMGFVQETAEQEKYAKNLETMIARILVLFGKYAKADTKHGIVTINCHDLSLELSLHAKGAKNMQDIILRAIDYKDLESKEVESSGE